MGEEITDEMRQEALKQAREAALQKRDEIQSQVVSDLPPNNLTRDEMLAIAKQNQLKAEAVKDKMERGQPGVYEPAQTPGRDEILQHQKEKIEDAYTDIKKYKSLGQLEGKQPPTGKDNYEERLLRQLNNKKNVGKDLGSLY